MGANIWASNERPLIAPDGKIANIWHKVKVLGHAAAVLAATQILTKS